jgi:polysaccharide export outer membrane protein
MVIKVFSRGYSLLTLIFSVSLLTSCVTSGKITYFENIKDSALVSSSAGLEAVIQKKDIISIAVSSLSNQASVLFNMPNQPATPTQPAVNNSYQTAGYLVNEDGNIKFPMLGLIAAAGRSQKQLEDTITTLLIEHKLLFDPIVTCRFLNFRITILGEVNHPGVIYVPSEQISVLEALGQAGDLTIYGIRDNVLLIRQIGVEKKLVRIDLTSSSLLQSPYYFLKSNDVLYVEANRAKIASSNLTEQRLPIVLSGLSLIIILLTNLFKL